MFERYTESARRILFFSRYEAAQAGSLAIESAHLVLGIVRESPLTLKRFSRGGIDIETLRRSLAVAAGERVSTSVEIPFSPQVKRTLQRAAEESDRLGNRVIAPEHLLLAVIDDEIAAPARALLEAGLEPEAIRGVLRDAPDGFFERTAAESQATRPFTAARAVPGAAAEVVLRQWRGVVKPGFAEQYLAHLRGETLPSLGQLSGFIDVAILRREVKDGTEFQVITVWRSVDSIKAFAGEDVTVAVVPAAAQAMMLRYDDRAVHYQVVQ